MTALIIIASIILVILFLLTRYAGIILVYRDDLTVTVTYGLIRYRLGKKSPAKLKKEKKKKAKKKKKKKKKKKTEEIPPSPPDPEAEKAAKRERRDAIMTVVKAVKDILPRFFGKVHFRSARLFCRIATGDAATTAIATGGAKAASSILFETIDNLAVLESGSEKNVAIEPDFIGTKPSFDINVRFRVRVIWAVIYGLKVLKEFIKAKIKSDNKKTK